MDSSPVSPKSSASKVDAGTTQASTASSSSARGSASTAGRSASGRVERRPLSVTILADTVRVVVFLVAVAIGAVSVTHLEGSTATIAATAAASAATGDWGYPLMGVYSKGRGSGYHPVPNCGLCSRYHRGYDMIQACGATVHAAGPGDVITAGASGGLGNAVRIDHGDGLVTIYGHMQWNSIVVSVGQHVTAGVPLGAEGTTGVSTGCHLHFEIQKDGTPVNPEIFMASIGLPLL
jgi:murein DD-endopeptidase MepM/ murein hydrolase activator NlpD